MFNKEQFLIEVANRAERRMRILGYPEDKIAKMKADATKGTAIEKTGIHQNQNNNVAPVPQTTNNDSIATITSRVKKKKQKMLKSGDAKRIGKANTLQNQQSGDNSGVSNIHTLKGSGNTATHLGTTKGKFVTQSVGNKVVNVGDHSAYKNTYKRGLAGQNAAARGGSGFIANNRKKNESYYFTAEDFTKINERNNGITETFDEFMARKYNLPIDRTENIIETFDEFLDRKYNNKNIYRRRYLLDQIAINEGCVNEPLQHKCKSIGEYIKGKKLNI